MTRERNTDVAEELEHELALAHRRMNQLCYPPPRPDQSEPVDEDDDS